MQSNEDLYNDSMLQEGLLQQQQREETLATQYIENEREGKYRDVKAALYEFYKNYKLKSDETKIDDLENKLNDGQIKCNKKEDLKSLFDVLAEENEGIGNCAVTAMAMTYYNTLSSDDINRKGLEKYIFREDDETNKFCDMEEFRFNMFIYYTLYELEQNKNSELNGIQEKFEKLYYEFTRGFSADLYCYTNNNPNPRDKFYYQEFSTYVRNQIVTAFQEVAKKNDELHKNKEINPNDEPTIRLNDNVNLGYLHVPQCEDLCYIGENQVIENIQNLCTNKKSIETDYVGIGLSRIAKKPVFILTLIVPKFKSSEGKPELSLKVFDAEKIEDETYGHRFNFTFSSDPKAKMRKGEIQLASNYLDLLSNCENKNPVLFYYDRHYTYLDPNNERKRELFSKCMKKLILDRYIKEADKKKVGSNLNNNLNPNQDNIKNQFEDNSKNSNRELSNFKLCVRSLYIQGKNLKDRLKQSQDELEKITGQLKEKQNNLKKQKSRMEENTRQIKKQEGEISCYEKSAIENEKKIEKMKQEKNELESQIKENNCKIKEQEDEISQCENDVKKQLDKMEINNKNAVMLEKEIATQEENHKAENKEEAKLFFRSPEFTDAKKSKFSITYFLAWIFCKLSDGFKNYVNQTRTIIDLDQKFNDLRLNIQNEGDTKDIASQICNTLDDFLLTCDDANLLKKYDVIYCYLLDLHERDMPSICKKLNENQLNSNYHNYQLFKQNCKGLVSKIEALRKSKNNDEESIISVNKRTNNNNNPLLCEYTSENIQK